MLRQLSILMYVILVGSTGVAHAQSRLDRADPAIVERALPQPKPPVDKDVTPTPPPPRAPATTPAWTSPVVSAIIVEGGAEIPRSTFSAAVLPFIGRTLSSTDLGELAGAVAGAARSDGYAFASASIDRQAMTGGVLRVQLDPGTLAAVRVIGAKNALADAILSKALVTGHAVRRAELEQAILLVGDLPGVIVKDSKYIRQDGFGILLVTISEDWASAYVQFDNRGSKEVGPIRSTLLANVRNVVGSGDELGLIVAQTPFQPSEFMFLRGRYSAPVGLHGATVTASASYGRAEPGAALADLDVLGRSYDGSVAFSLPVVRGRHRSVWAAAELRALQTKQALLGIKLRDDQLVTLSGSINATVDAGGGTVRGELTTMAGLPFAWVTREQDRLKSRTDGDARFVTVGYSVDWTKPITKAISMVLASQAQLASRPLLSSMEIGAGGPGFGRAYDYAERTGDDGILGSVEMRIDTGSWDAGVIDRSQVYGFVDGGTVGNLRGGQGGGNLLSTGAGVRLGGKVIDGMVEVAMPLNADRFDTGDRQPRISFRLSKVF